MSCSNKEIIVIYLNYILKILLYLSSKEVNGIEGIDNETEREQREQHIL